MAVRTGGVTLPTSQEEAVVLIFDRLLQLEDSHTDLMVSLSEVQYAAPAKPREGNFAFADGTTWNPGSGRGLYQYVSGAWVKL